MGNLDKINVPGVSIILSAAAADTSSTLMCVYSYFDGDLPEEEKLKVELKSEEEEEEVTPGQKKATHKSQR